MRQETIEINGAGVPLIITRAAVIGSGAAALNGAVHLKKMGVDDLVIVTERIGAGTSANAGSDKQTYYRVSPSDPGGDSVWSMAETLYAGGAMHGDIALAEAASSEREFYHLVEMGVPFAHDRYGVYGGYVTDHDPRGRGTSAGPETSVMMFHALLDEVKRLGINIMDHTGAVDIITADDEHGKAAVGLIALRLDGASPASFGMVVIKADFIVMGTGGPGALYENSVYPPSQEGSLGMALRAGATAQNLCESQFGIASVPVRWNLSGSYQQVLPRYVSFAQDGRDEREFLNDFFPDPAAQLSAQFLKGYQWPFDVRKISNYGSSCIDLLVYREHNILGRKVCLDFTRNPSLEGRETAWRDFPPAARDYLERSCATGNTPVERLRRMNRPALDFFKSQGIDLAREPLEIAVCHQHNNGGIRGSIWWESGIANLFPVGEANGSHGIYRPGGSALNAGQVGSLRAAAMIAHRAKLTPPFDMEKFSTRALGPAAARMARFSALLSAPLKIDLDQERLALQRRMSRAMGIIRGRHGVAHALKQNREAMVLRTGLGITGVSELYTWIRNEDLLVTERCFLESAMSLMRRFEEGRGSFIAGDTADIFIDKNGALDIRAVLCDERFYREVQELCMDAEGSVTVSYLPARPVPAFDQWFERDWADFLGGRLFERQ